MVRNAELHIEKVNAITRQDEDDALGLSTFVVEPEQVMQDVQVHLGDAIQYEVDMVKAEVYSRNDWSEKAFGILGEYAERSWLEHRFLKEAAQLGNPYSP